MNRAKQCVPFSCSVNSAKPGSWSTPWAAVVCHQEYLLPHEDLIFQVQIAYPSLSVNLYQVPRLFGIVMMSMVVISRKDAKTHLNPYFTKVKPVPCFSFWEIECLSVAKFSRTLLILSDPTITSQACCWPYILLLKSARMAMLCGGREWPHSPPKEKRNKAENNSWRASVPRTTVDNSLFRPLSWSCPIPPPIPTQWGNIWVYQLLFKHC